MELVAHLSEQFEGITIGDAGRVSVVDGEPQGDYLEWHDVHADVCDVETQEVETEAKVCL